MIARLAMPADREAVLAMGEAGLAETAPHLPFERDVAEASYDRAMQTGHPVVWVADHRRQIAGYLVGVLEEYFFCSGVFVGQEVLYVRPEMRGSRAAAVLLREFTRWGRAIGARERFYGVSNGFRADRTTRLIHLVTGAHVTGAVLRGVG